MNKKHQITSEMIMPWADNKKNDKGEKMYIQTQMAQYAGELWEILKT